jgi:anti-sigma regulatory factor (Ser/Thr protein kinase)
VFTLSVTESSQVGDVRRRCVEAATALGFDAVATGRVAIVATELATNLLRHGGGGEILCGPVRPPDVFHCHAARSRPDAPRDAGGAYLDVLALDRGPGMAEPLIWLTDGRSTAGSAGIGLGAVQRQAVSFAIHSRPGRGTAVLARLGAGPLASPGHTPPSPPSLPAWGAVCVPCRGETVSGDAWAAVEDNGVRVFLMADGLGHGPEAGAAAAEAVLRFRQAPLRPPAVILEAIHLALRPTRGAAVAIARMEPGRVIFAGIGNIGGAVLAEGGIRRMVSHNGTAGHHARRISAFEYPCPPGATLVMHSDGIASSWWPLRHPEVPALHPTLAAALLYRDHTRGRDDCCVLLAEAEKS